MTSEQLGYVFEKLLIEGALDVYFTSIMMKKNRPGIKLTVICKTEDKDKISELLLKETTTFGIRYAKMQRDILDREIIEANTPYGKIRIKVGKYNNKIIKHSPEYEDCKQIAKSTGKSITEIYAAARRCIKQGGEE